MNNVKIPKGAIIIAGVVDGVASISSDPKIHLTPQTAQAEAVRLAQTTPGKQFSVLQCLGTVSIPQPKVVWN